MTLSFKLAAAKFVGYLARTLGKGGGTAAPGGALLALDSKAIGKLSSKLSNGSAVISATNGKTTTAAMVAEVLKLSGRAVVNNGAGANLASGVASTLLAASTLSGKVKGDTGLFEIDEFWLNRVVPQLNLKALLLANLFRDQLDRYGELETIGERWQELVDGLPQDSALILNADDPLVADLGRTRSGKTIFFGIEDTSLALSALQHASDSKHCRRCGSPYVYSAVFLGHLGHYSCSNCDAVRPQPEVFATNIKLIGTQSANFMLTVKDQQAEITLKLPGLYNVYNAVAAAALSYSLGADITAIREGLARTEAAFGRAQRIAIDGKELLLLLIKNPVGANEVVRTLLLEDQKLTLLAALNDQIADGRDVSWVWDADFELLADRIETVFCSGSRAAELALRFKYAGVPSERIRTVSNLENAFDQALAATTDGPLYTVPTYTAMLSIQALLKQRGLTDAYWEQP